MSKTANGSLSSVVIPALISIHDFYSGAFDAHLTVAEEESDQEQVELHFKPGEMDGIMLAAVLDKAIRDAGRAPQYYIDFEADTIVYSHTVFRAKISNWSNDPSQTDFPTVLTMHANRRNWVLFLTNLLDGLMLSTSASRIAPKHARSVHAEPPANG